MDKKFPIDNKSLQKIPYGRQLIDDEDIAAVCSVLRSDWITTGPKVSEFEQAVADYVGAKYAIAVSSGTAALHCAMYAINIECEDEVITSPMTFAATANSVVYQGGTPVFADINSDTLLIDPDKIEEKISNRTKALVSVDYAGQPCDYDRLKDITDRYGLFLIGDSCHSLGAKYKGQKVGKLADLTIFSFHPVKHICTGEGGMIVTDNHIFADRMRAFRNHGILSEHHKRDSWYYEMTDLGFNYRLTDFQCAMGISQIKKLPDWLKCRQEIAMKYDEAFKTFPPISLLKKYVYNYHAYHLYVVIFKNSYIRSDIFNYLKNQGIGVNVHYIPVYLHPFYKVKLGTFEGLCPLAEDLYKRILSLPIFPGMNDSDVNRVICSIKNYFNNRKLTIK